MGVSKVEETTRRLFLKSLILVAILAVALSGYVGSATANVPTIVSIENVSRPTGAPSSGVGQMEATVALTINHQGPTSSHYVDLIQVQWNGQTHNFTQEPQTSNPFTATLDLGETLMPGESLVAKARVHCTLHGWSDWSAEIPVPEFPLPAIAAFLALAASVAIITRSKKCSRKPSTW
jgi:hypothetical protein